MRRSQAYLAQAQTLSHTGSFGWSVTSGEIFWSEETFRIFAYDRTIKPTVDLVFQRCLPEDRALVQQTINRASQDGKDFAHEYRLLMPDDSVKYLRVVAHALSDESGSIEFVGAVMDITAAKEVEDRIRLIINTVPGLHWSARPDGWVDFINQRWLDYTGMTLEQALGWGWAPAYHPDEIEQVQVEWRAALAEGKPLEMETASGGSTENTDGSWNASPPCLTAPDTFSVGTEATSISTTGSRRKRKSGSRKQSSGRFWISRPSTSPYWVPTVFASMRIRWRSNFTASLWKSGWPRAGTGSSIRTIGNAS